MTTSIGVVNAMEDLPAHFNVGQALVELGLAPQRRARAAFYFQDAVYTPAAIAEGARHWAARLLAAGVRQEERVALLLPDSPDLVAALLATLCIGAIAVPINQAYGSESVDFIVEESRARVVVTDASGAARLGNRGAMKWLLPELWSDARPADAKLEFAATYRDEPCLWLYTSGSTGRPKAVMHAHGALPVAAERYARQTLGLTEHDVIYSVARIPFAYGLGASFYFPLWLGASAVLSSSTQPFDYVADIHRYRPSVLFGIPNTYDGLLSVDEIAPLEASSLRLCVSAAESLPQQTFERFRARHGLGICEGFGSSEMLHVFLSNDPRAPRPGWSGKAVPGYGLRIVDEGGRELADGEPGLLEVEGDTLMLGYFNRLERTRRAIRHRAMLTGDRCVRDRDGYFRYLGRVDDLFKVNGQWVAPTEIERVLLEHPEVRACAALRDTTEGAAGVVAYVAIQDGVVDRDGLARELRMLARGKLSGFMVPRRIEFVSGMPKTATGKIDRGALRRSVQASEVSDG